MFIKITSIFAVLTDGDCIHFAGQAIKLLISYMGYFYAHTLGYWRLPLRRLLYALRGGASSVSSVNGSRFLYKIKSAYNISLNANRYE